jgi:hypothetical protein
MKQALDEPRPYNPEVQKMDRAGKLPALHGRWVRIGRADFDALLDASVIGNSQPAPSNIRDSEIPLPDVPGEAVR